MFARVMGLVPLVMIAAAARASDPGEAILTLEGPGGLRHLTLADLRAMPAVSLSTSTLWTEGVIQFTGVPLAELTRLAGAPGADVSAVALNDYAVEIPGQGIGADYPIVAYLMDGQPFSPRDKGPLWIVYPYDSDAAFRSDDVFARSVWQLTRLIVQP